MEDILVENSNGAKCVIHCRVSSSKQAAEGESLEIQTAVCARIAADRGWVLAHEPWQESFSGRKSVRPVFQDVLAFLDSCPGEVHFYIFRSIDRFTRGGSYPYEQMKRALSRRGVEMIDSFGLIQPPRNTLAELGLEYQWSRVSPSEIAEVVLATTAKHEVSSILTRLIGQEIRLTRRGYKVRSPHDGYLNSKVYEEGKRRTIQVPDPDRAKYIVAMFEMRASSLLSDPDICSRVNAMGYRTKSQRRWDSTHQKVLGYSTGRPLTPTRLQSLIRRPIYCGILCEKWTEGKAIRTAYPGLISIELFNRANRGKIFVREHPDSVEILYDFNPERIEVHLNRNNPLFPFRHVVTCSQCRKPLLGSSPRGRNGNRYPIYHCARKHPYFGVSKSALEDTLYRYLDNLRYPSGARRFVERICREAFAEHAHWADERADLSRRALRDLESRKTELVRAFSLARTEVVRRAIEAQIVTLDKDMREAKAAPADRVSKDDVAGYIATIQELMETIGTALRKPGDSAHIRAVYSLVFEEFPTVDMLRDGTAKLRNFFYVSSDFNTRDSTLVHQPRINWNQLEAAVLHWKAIAPLVKAHMNAPQSPQPPSGDGSSHGHA